MMMYLLTFRGYGTHLHGDICGSWKYGKPHPYHPRLVRAMRDLMVQSQFLLTAHTRPVVLASLIELATTRNWNLRAAHVRSTHVNLVIDCEAAPERVMVTAKAVATKALNHADGDQARKRWPRGGHTRQFRTYAAISAAVHYVLNGQGSPMSVYAS